MTGKRTTKPDHDHPDKEAIDEPDTKDMDGSATVDKRMDDIATELEEANARHLRLAADFENFKKRSRQDRVELLEYASAKLAEQLLPVLDDFERALEHAPEGVDQHWLKGVQMTVGKLREALASAGVEPIEAAGSHFDPKLHEAIATEESDEHPEDTVLDEVRRGYRMHDRVLRPALVRVARLPTQGE
jgi:molecular chaperone GrpE